MRQQNTAGTANTLVKDEKTLAKQFVEQYAKRIQEKHWQNLEAESLDSKTFYDKANTACTEGFAVNQDQGAEKEGAWSDEDAVKALLEVLAKRDAAIRRPTMSGAAGFCFCITETKSKISESNGPNPGAHWCEYIECLAKEAADNEELGNYYTRILNSPVVQNLCQIAKTMDENDEADLRRTLSSDLARLQPFSAVARDVMKPMNVRVDSGPGKEEWQWIWKTIQERTKNDFSWCSLIHPYWLDEASLPWAVERLVDRIENGVVASTRPLMSIRVAETGDLPSVISTYAHSWQQGDLAAVDERRRQYLATYGFPLFSATRWGQLETVDPNRGFPAAFHGFLASAMQFYRDSRNTQMIPDAEGVLKAFDQLGRMLREHNENLRRVRTTEIRGQMEYVKQVLGGLKAEPPTKFQEDWSAALPGRPGVRKSMDPWEFAVDTVADLYQWRRPSVTEYRALAENGEVLLVLTRIFTASDVDLKAQTMWALLDILREPIRQYTSSYKVVTGVDLAAPNPFLGAPALAMARQQMQPPAIPPLRRSWAVELPAA